MLNTDERTELQRRVRGRKSRAEDARRARVILMLAAGESFTAITATLGCYPDYINRWKRRFEAARLAGLRARYCGQPPTVRPPPPPPWKRASWRRRGSARQMAVRTGARGSWPRCSGSATSWSPACGGGPGCSRIAWSVTCAPTIPTLKKKPRMSWACISTPRSMPSSSRLMKAQPGRTVVWEDRTRPPGSRYLHVGPRPRPQDSALHHVLQQGPETDSLDLQHSGASNNYSFS